MAARIERLAMSDLMMLIPDDVGWPQDIGAIGILELPPRETVDTLLFRVRNVIASRLHLVPRFRQVIETPPIAFGVPYWRDDSSFDIVDHVRIHELPSGSTDDDLRACFEVLRARRFVMSRPLWEVWLVPGLARGRVGLIVKVHHALADGMSALAQVMTFLDVSSTSATQSPRPWTPAVAPTKGALLVDNVRQRSFQVCRLLLQLLRPWRIFGAYRRWSALLHEVLGREDAPATSLQRPIGPNRRISVVRTALADIKVIAHANDAKVNDVLLSLMASGARALMQSRGERVDGVVLRASVPIAQHANRAEAKGNQDGGMLVELPIGGELDERQRLHAIARDTAMRKQQPRPTFNVLAFPGSLTLMRRFMRGMRTQRLANLYAANI